MPGAGVSPAAMRSDLGHRQRRDERRQRRHDARGVARRARARRRQRLEVAAQAGRPAGNGHRDAPLLAHAGRVDRRQPERARGVRDEQARLEVVGAVEDEVVAGEELPRVPVREVGDDGRDRAADGSISREARRRGFGLRRDPRGVLGVEEELAREVRLLDDVAVDERDPRRSPPAPPSRPRPRPPRRRRRTRSRSARIRCLPLRRRSRGRAPTASTAPLIAPPPRAGCARA